MISPAFGRYFVEAASEGRVPSHQRAGALLETIPHTLVAAREKIQNLSAIGVTLDILTGFVRNGGLRKTDDAIRDENQCQHKRRLQFVKPRDLRDTHAPLAFLSHTLSLHFRISDFASWRGYPQIRLPLLGDGNREEIQVCVGSTFLRSCNERQNLNIREGEIFGFWQCPFFFISETGFRLGLHICNDRAILD